MPRLRLRDATAEDLGLTHTITEDAMRGYVEETWGRWDNDEFQKHRTNFTPETHKVILIGEVEAGFVAVEELSAYIWLVKLYILAVHRDGGIGSEILQGILRDAKAKGKPVQLRVLKVNTRAQSLYAKHGFRVIEETTERLVMQSVA